MLIAAYDYWGYYNVCFLGDEVKDPDKTIPHALLLSILLVGCLYVVMNISILGVVPWQEMTQSGASNRGLYVVSIFMQRVYGAWAANLVTAMVMWTAFASVFSLMLGYSRVPYAAALDGNYFKAFARVHPEHRFPYISYAVFCLKKKKNDQILITYVCVVPPLDLHRQNSIERIAIDSHYPYSRQAQIHFVRA